MIQAVIFDMDGTMVDSEKLWSDVGHKFAERYGAVMDTNIRRQMMGKKDSDSLSAFRDYFHITEDVEELARVRRKMMLEDTSMVRVNEGLFELLDLLDRRGAKKAVATSSFKEFATTILTNLDLIRRFDVVVTGDDVTLGKPNPAIFLEAAKLLGVPADECLVLEDAENGVEAAHRAGMRVLAIPHGHSDYHDFSKATRILKSMHEVDEALLAIL